MIRARRRVLRANVPAGRLALSRPSRLPSPPAGAHQPAEAYVAPAVSSTAEAYFLGTFKLVVRGAELTCWKSGRARQLFQFLALHRNRPIPRETLLETLWPDPDAAAPDTSLKVAAHALRQTFAQAPGCDLRLETGEVGYTLSVPNLWLDIEEFQQLTARARTLERQDEMAGALAAHQAAVELYGGHFIAESYDDWVLLRRESLKDRYLLSVARLADAALDRRDYHGCLLYCQKLLEHDSCREDAYRRIMLCHARLGQPTRVRSWYELCVRTLRTELEAEPEPETTWLFERALRGEFDVQMAV
jgi:DNA-binding SARP family transcriptional activator